MSTALVTKTYNSGGINTQFSFRDDGWFNMTKAAKAFGKDLSHFARSPDTEAYLAALKSARNAEYVEASRGRYGGTWAHPKLAVFFARWLDVKFAVWCDAMIEDILKGAAEVVITKPEESAVMALPTDFETAVEALLVTLRQKKAAEQACRQAEAEVAVLAPKAARLVAEADSLQGFLRTLQGVNVSKMWAYLEKEGLIHRKATGRYHATRFKGNHIREATIDEGAAGFSGLMVDPRGKVELLEWYRTGRLPMQANCRPCASAYESGRNAVRSLL